MKTWFRNVDRRGRLGGIGEYKRLVTAVTCSVYAIFLAEVGLLSLFLHAMEHLPLRCKFHGPAAARGWSLSTTVFTSAAVSGPTEIMLLARDGDTGFIFIYIEGTLAESPIRRYHLVRGQRCRLGS